ncbi:purine/pyrimidine permease [Domibacillus robiginosus]|uniref:purine/pyrimidine permease n=1 Tax=Domibacillus robiginosus TaxID=1071054 RepID=UPI0009E2F120|nr:purine/pyrimidine permease [Domibacillus robiginosus]
MIKLAAGSLQWAVFLIASSIAAPVAIAGLFHLDASATAEFVQRTMLVLGAAGILQSLFGHKLPINEGPAGLWWGVFTIYAGFSGILYSNSESTLQVLQSGMLYAGVLFVLFAVSGLVNRMKSLFTPTITFVYLLLLVLQLSGTFVKGMMGLPNEEGRIDLIVVLGSLLTLGFTFWITGHRNPLVRRYSVLISIGTGWMLFGLIGKSHLPSSESDTVFSLPDIFAFGPPVFDGGMLVTSFFITLLLVANMMASIRVMEGTLKREFGQQAPNRIRQAGIFAGINHLMAGVFSAVGPVPISGAAGFVSATKMRSVWPFALGCFLIVAVTCFPSAMLVLSSLPAPVAYAVTFVLFTGMVRMAFYELNSADHIEQSLKVAAIGLMTGVGFMFLPPESVSELPAALSAILSNGLLTGTITALIYEQWLLWRAHS